MLATRPDTDTGKSSAAGRHVTWSFVGAASLPSDPAARELERSGRRWLVVSYLLCPCHLPVTLGLLTVAFGGTALGSAVAGNTGWVGAAITLLYAAVLWRGFRRIHAAKRLASLGLEVDCSGGTCDVRPSRSGAPTEQR